MFSGRNVRMRTMRRVMHASSDKCFLKQHDEQDVELLETPCVINPVREVMPRA